jgi:hypothetical protein
VTVRTALAHRSRRRVEDIELRVAVSVAHLGLIARLVAVSIGSAALGAPNASLAIDDLWWQDELGGPFPLSISRRPTAQRGLSGSAIETITLRFAGQYTIAPRVLWGNVGSAANSAANLVQASHPDAGPAAKLAADAILADPRIDGGELKSGPRFRRDSCCLIYRLAEARQGVCGDCVLVR